MPRRRVSGIAAIHKKNKQKDAFNQKGQQIQEERLQQMQERIVFFRTKLKEFAQKYRKQIRANPEFRHHFHDMCLKIGVDPLANSKGFWSELLGVGDFYYELAVQIVELCYSGRAQNGGLLKLQDLKRKLEQRRNKYSGSQKSLSMHDVREAIGTLQKLGHGFKLIQVGKIWFVQSVPCELNRDHTAVLAQVTEQPGITLTQLAKGMNIQVERALKVVDSLMNEGIVWVDDKGMERAYYVR